MLPVIKAAMADRSLLDLHLHALPTLLVLIYQYKFPRHCASYPGLQSAMRLDSRPPRSRPILTVLPSFKLLPFCTCH